MPDRIIHLPQDLANQIAAGEVVERPASVLKELIENSIDADSSRILIRIERGGAGLISVADNGIGMSAADTRIAFDRHATSKISSKQDLFNIRTLGFRGEALASIAAVSHTRLKTRERGAALGTCVEIKGGELVKNIETGCPEGTEIDVRDIFFNVPARKSFLKSISTETGHMLSVVTQIAIAYEQIHLTLMNMDRGERVLLDLPPVRNLGERLFQIHGGDVVESLIPISFKEDGYHIMGYISKPTLTFKSRENQIFFVNNRAIRNTVLSHAVRESYSDLISGDRYPMVILCIRMDPALVDVNVHPSKREVKFKDNKRIHDMTVEVIREFLQVSSRPYDHISRHVNEGVRYELPGNDFSLFSEGDFTQQAEITSGPSVRVFGQISALYIIAEINGDLNIIDQHAAHERVIYDRLKRGYSDRHMDAQFLLVPETLDLSPDKARILSEYKALLNEIGFDVEEIGEKSFMIRTLPAILSGENPRSLIADMVDEIIEMDMSSAKRLRLLATEDIIRALLSRKACHQAVRAQGLLSIAEMTSLLTALLETEMPYTCPHGRPVLRKFSSEELAKMFDRK